MKKLVNVVALALFVFVLAGCSWGVTPEMRAQSAENDRASKIGFKRLCDKNPDAEYCHTENAMKNIEEVKKICMQYPSQEFCQPQNK